MDDSINVSTQVLVDTAGKIRSINTNLDSKLAEINKCMNDLGNTWKSEGATEIIAAMNALKPRFEEYKGIIESYAKYLEHTAQDYDVAEGTVTSNANAFK